MKALNKKCVLVLVFATLLTSFTYAQNQVVDFREIIKKDKS